MDELSLAMDFYGQVEKFQPVFVAKSMIYTREKDRGKFGDLKRSYISWKQLV